MAVRISEACIGCQACIPACPYEALYIHDDGLCRVVEKNCDECKKCLEACPVSALNIPPGEGRPEPPGISGEKTEKGSAGPKAAPAAGDPDLHRGVWVFIEQQEGEIARVSLELLGAGRGLADKLGVELSGVLLGDKVEGLAETVFEHGADRVYLVDDPVLRHYRAEAYMRAFVNLAREHLPEIVLMGATTTGRDLAGAVATELATGLTADCTGLDIDMAKRLLLATRPAFGGNIMATIVAKKHRPQMATVRPRVMPMPQPQPGRRGTLVRARAGISENDIATRVLEIVKGLTDEVNLQDAEIIVAGGRGLGDRESFNKICYGLADAIGAKVGGSRAAVEAGWIDPKYQVGQTGVTVAPKLYIALGISGAIQHLVGIRGSDVIVAVNNNPSAPIFKECNYGIVGDVFKVAPLLKDPLKNLLARKITGFTKRPTGLEGRSLAGKI